MRFVLFILSYYVSVTLLVPCYDVLCECLIRSRNCLPTEDTYVHLHVCGPYWALFFISFVLFFVFCFIYLVFFGGGVSCLCSVSCAQYCLHLRIVYSWLSFGFPLGLFISIPKTHYSIFSVISLSVRLTLGGPTGGLSWNVSCVLN